MNNSVKVEDFRPKMDEHQEQASFFQWLHLMHLRNYPEIHPLFFAVPNGMPVVSGGGHSRRVDERRRYAIINKMKSEGLTPGVFDTLFMSGRGGFLGLAMEFKTVGRAGQARGGLSEAQEEFKAALKSEGYLAEVAYGADHAGEIVETYLHQPKTQDLIFKALKCLNTGEVHKAEAILKSMVSLW